MDRSVKHTAKKQIFQQYVFIKVHKNFEKNKQTNTKVTLRWQKSYWSGCQASNSKIIKETIPSSSYSRKN